MEFIINESGADNNTYRYNVKAFYGPSGDRPPDLALEMSLTVEPEKYPDGSLGAGRYLIRELQARGSWSNISAEGKTKEAA